VYWRSNGIESQSVWCSFKFC